MQLLEGGNDVDGGKTCAFAIPVPKKIVDKASVVAKSGDNESKIAFFSIFINILRSSVF